MQEDPSVNELEEKAAKITGKEAALFVSSGTQGNLVSILSQTNPGDEIMVEELSHVFGHEVGSVARIGGLMVRTYPSDKGVPSFEALQDMIRNRNDIHEPPTTLFSVENTHNFHGGVIIKPEVLQAMKSFAQKNDLRFHMDGARIFNAAVAMGKSVNELAKYMDSITFCLSKGLACPVGSLVAGSQDFIDRARKYRKMLGGGMRQAGIIASFGLIALESKWIQRLGEDHENAKILANGLKELSLKIEVQEPDTNILLVEILENKDVNKILLALSKEGILAFSIDRKTIRFVTHYGINEDDIQYSIEKIGAILS
jgi:threonine aldolase